MKNFNPTEKCLDAALIIMNGEERIKTSWGTKTKLGIADLVYREAGVGDLLEACESAMHELRVRCGYKKGDSCYDELIQVLEKYNKRLEIGRLGGLKK